MPASFDSPDPLALLLAPPSNESPTDRAGRIAAEAEARRISEQIDDDLRRERAEQRKWEKEKRTVKVLLLGQSESGKSTTIKSTSPSSSFSKLCAMQCSSYRSSARVSVVVCVFL